MKIITMDIRKCVACRNCELACAFAKSGRTCERPASMIRVNHYLEERAVIPLTCLHCEEAWCLEVCPAGAISRAAGSNAVVIDQSRCAGCKMCMLACPYGNIHFDEEKLVSQKCDLCDGKPRCVGHCIAGALQYEEAEDFAAARRRSIDQQLAQRLKNGCREESR